MAHPDTLGFLRRVLHMGSYQQSFHLWNKFHLLVFFVTLCSIQALILMAQCLSLSHTPSVLPIGDNMT